MSRKAVECENCGSEYTLVYDSDDLVDDPTYCPFCGELAKQDESELDIGEAWDE
jgi:DNA replicative helicase MCM subunit Mcm2 (Cdc46/Mcm family)